MIMIVNLEVNLDEFCWESDITKFWEVEIDCPSSQITDVQGWLRKSLKFGKGPTSAYHNVRIYRKWLLPALQISPSPHHQQIIN